MSKIMVVDDEDSIRAAVKVALELEGFEVSEAESADAAWKKLQKSKPDLLLLDVMMPGMTPRELIKKIRDDTKLKDLKIIFVTAVMGAKEALKDTKGIVATVEKPFDNKKLVAEIKKALK